MKRKAWLSSSVLILCMLASMLSGCKGSGKEQATNNGSDDNKPKNITFKYWVPFGGTAKEKISGLGENDVYIELEKRTGIKIEFIHPAEGQETEQFNLMIASGDLPDIIEQGERYKGGIDKAITDKNFIKLNDLVDKHAPNFKKIIDSNPEIKKQIYSDNGNLLGFGMITTDNVGTDLTPNSENPWCGPFLRKDWLDELKLSVPTTVDQWYTVLKAFKDQKKAEVPILWDKTGVQYTTGVFLTAYDVAPAFYIKNNEIKYGPLEQGYKSYLEAMSKWYKEGLIDKDFPARDTKSGEALYMGGKAGALMNEGTGLVLKARAVNIEFAGAPLPQIDEKTPIHWKYKNNIVRANYGVITSACKYPEEAVKWFDYHYTEEGYKLFNFGVEGKSYSKINEKGQPVYADYISHDNYIDFDKLNTVFRLHNGPYLKSDLRSNPRRMMEDLEAYRRVWDKQPSDYVLPPTTMTDTEGKEYATIMADVESYRNEMVLKFIMGTEPISKFDEFVKKIKDMNIDKAISIQKAALDRYNKR